MSQNTPV